MTFTLLPGFLRRRIRLLEPDSAACPYETLEKFIALKFAESSRIRALGGNVNHDSRIYDEPDLDYDVFTEGPWTVPLSTLRELPYGCKCRVCRSSFRSKKARDGYCFSCRQIIEDRTKELDQILVHAAHSRPGEQQKAIARVRALLTCPILAVGWRIRCDWAGNAARQWPETIAGFRRVLRVFVERHLRHVWQEHCSPARFGRASQRRERKQFERLCRLPEDKQPEGVKQYFKWFEH